MTQLTPDEIEEVSEVFDLFDFWDGRDGQVDGDRVGDWLRCCGLNPTDDLVLKTGGEKMNDKSFTLDELLPIFHDVSNSKVCGTFADFMEAFKTFDREGQGFISSAELRHVLTFLGEKLNDEQVDDILKWTDTQEDLDGNCKYEEFIKKVMDGPKK